MNNTPDKIKPDFSSLFTDYPENEISQLIDQCTGILGLIFEIDGENLELPDNKLNALYAIDSNLRTMSAICKATNKARLPKTREQLERKTLALKTTPNNETGADCGALITDKMIADRMREIATLFEQGGAIE